MKKTARKQSILGMYATRLNAFFLTKIFGKEANEKVPVNMTEVKNMLKKNQVVFCGALRYKDNNTSDGTAAELAEFLHSRFINITDVKGLYDKNPKTNKNAKFIREISWEKFYERARKIKFSAGQHFVLDQRAARIIYEKKIPTYITNSLSDVKHIIEGKPYKGSLIEG